MSELPTGTAARTGCDEILVAACAVEAQYPDHAAEKSGYARRKIAGTRIGAANVRRNRAGSTTRIIIK